MCAKLSAQNSNPVLLVKQEAQLKAPEFLNLIPEGREKEYGFANRNDFAKIKLEEPYETYYVNDKAGKLHFTSANEWRVPVAVNGTYVTLLTVQVVNGKAEVVDFGGNVLAQKLQEFEKLHGTKKNERVIIRNVFLKQDFMTANFKNLHKQNTGANAMELNKQTTEPLYLINKEKPAKTSVALFYSETMQVIKNTNGTK